MFTKILAAGVLGMMTLPAAAFAQTVTVGVDCSRGRSINRILSGVRASALIVEVHGICVEDVLVTRDNVTLRGADLSLDGIRPTSSAIGAVAVTVRGAMDVAVERLTLSGGYVGLRSQSGAVVRVSGARLTGNTAWGSEVWPGSAATFEDTSFDHNHLGGLWTGGSARCVRCTITDNLHPDGLVTSAVLSSEYVALEDSTVSGPIGLSVDSGARAWLLRSALSGDSSALNVSSGGDVAMTGGTLGGPFRIGGGALRLAGVTQEAGSDANEATNRAWVELDPWGGAGTTMKRTLHLDRFSNATAQGATLETLTCASGADAWCDATTTASGSSCALCPRP